MSLRSLLAVLLLTLGRLTAAEQNQLDFSPSLFSVLAAINAAGYDGDIQSPSNHPVRHQIRKILASKNIPSLVDLKRFIRDHRQENDQRTLSLYISFALCVDGPPNFKYRIRVNDLPPEVAALEGLAEILQRFHKEAGIDELWKQVQGLNECILGGCKLKDGTTIEGYHEPVTRAVLESNAYLRNPTSGYLGSRFQIYLDLLGAPNQVLAKSFGDDFFVVVTHSPQPSVDAIRHYYLQFSVSPYIMRQKEIFEQKKALADFAEPAPLLPDIYKKDFLMLAEKSFVKAVESRLMTGPNAAVRRQQHVDQALGEGYILTPFFAEALPLYEKQEQSMRFHFPELIKTLDLKKEDKRLEKVQFATTANTRRIKAPVAPQPEQSPTEKSLEQAEDLMASKQYDAARGRFLELLKETDDRGAHAKAYYGLSRVALAKNDAELADRLFQKVLELSPDPATKASTLVYLGRLEDAAVGGDGAKAIGYYKAALAVEGGSERVRETAKKGLAGEFRRKAQ